MDGSISTIAGAHGLIVENNGYNTNGYYINVWHTTDVGDDDLVSALWFTTRRQFWCD